MNKVLCAFFIALLTCNALAGDFEDGFHAAEKGDYKKALPLIKDTAKQGNAMAQVLLGFMYKNGKGQKQNLKEAVNLFRLAAIQGDADGQYNLGVMYDSGNAVKQDYIESAKWYQLAA